MKFRWTIKELKEYDPIEFAVVIINERMSELSMYCPLYEKLAKTRRELQSLKDIIPVRAICAPYHTAEHDK